MGNKRKIISGVTTSLAIGTFGGASVVGTSSCSTDVDPVVETDNGKVVGSIDDDNDVVSFKGIPYAAPMNAANRFSAPTEHAKWDGVLECKAYGKDPMQIAGVIAGINLLDMSEDCLTLNIWAPRDFKSKNYPVYFWIYGGAYVMGSGSQETYDGTSFAKQGIIAITINYRLNAFGFYPTANQYDGKATFGNMGLLDQIQALKWVQKNIKAFGGDKDNVTIGGESAGSWSVTSLLISPLTAGKNYFKRAICESGSIIGIDAFANRIHGYKGNENDPDSAESAYQVAKEVAEFCGMENFQTSTDAQRVAYLKTTQWYSLCLELFDLQHPILSELGLLPILDGAMLPAMTSMTDSWRPSGSKSIYNYLANGSNQINDVDILFGYNSAEGWLFGQEAAIGDLDWYIDNNIDNRSSIKSPVVGSASSEFQLYMAEHYPSLSDTWQLQQLISSSVFGTSVANKIPNAIAKRNPNSKIYGYNFNWWGDVDNPQNGPFASLGIPSVHASELPYAFNCIDSLWIDQDTPQKELDEATKMHTMWGNFIKNGNPNLAGKSDWQPYANTDAQPYSGQIMNFGPTGDTYGLPIDIDGGAREYITKFVDYWMFGIGNDPSDI